MKFKWSLVPGYLLAVFSAIGNSLVIFLVLTRRNIRTTTNWFVLSLAVADLSVAVVFYPIVSSCTKAPDQMQCSEQSVRIALLVGSSFVFASMTNLCALTLDRYLAIVHALRYVTFMTKKRVALFISAAWTVPFPMLVFSLVYALSSEEWQKLVANAMMVFCIPLSIVPGIFLLFATVRIFLVVRRIAKENAAVVAQLNFNHKLQHGVAFKARESSSAKMIGIVVTVYLVSYVWYILYMLAVITGQRRLAQHVADITTLLVIFNSAVNPVAYALHKREIKRELRRLFRRNRRRHEVPTNSGAREVQRELYELRLLRNAVTPRWGAQYDCSMGRHEVLNLTPSSWTAVSLWSWSVSLPVTISVKVWINDRIVEEYQTSKSFSSGTFWSLLIKDALDFKTQDIPLSIRMIGILVTVYSVYSRPLVLTFSTYRVIAYHRLGPWSYDGRLDSMIAVDFLGSYSRKFLGKSELTSVARFPWFYWSTCWNWFSCDFKELALHENKASEWSLVTS